MTKTFKYDSRKISNLKLEKFAFSNKLSLYNGKSFPLTLNQWAGKYLNLYINKNKTEIYTISNGTKHF